MANIIRKSEVFTVSAASFGFAFGGTLLLLVLSTLTKLRGTAVINLLLGRETSATLLQTSQENISSLFDVMLSNNALGRATVFALWMLVGLLVYTLISIVQKAATRVKEIEEDLESVHVDRAQFISDLLRDVLLRTGVAFGWAVFALLSFQLILPFFVSAIYVVFGPYASLPDFLLALTAVLVVLISLHIHVVFARLFVGRIRLFGI